MVDTLFFALLGGLALWNLWLLQKLRSRKRIQKELEYSQKRFRTIFEYTNVGMAFGDSNGDIKEVNSAFCEMLGYSREELIGKNFQEFTLQRDAKNELVYLEELVRGERDFYSLEKRYIRKDGVPFWVNIVVSAIRSDVGDSYVAAVIDINDQKLLEGELKFVNEQLADQIEHEVSERMKIQKEKSLQDQVMAQKQKMAEMGEMIGIIAHQWKQPLNAISVESQVLEDLFDEGELDAEEMERYQRSIYTQVSFMAQTIDDFRNFFKPSVGKCTFGVNEIVDKVLGIIKPLLEKNDITLNFSHGSELVIYGYPNEFMQVVLNIINNAKDIIIEKKIEHGRVDITTKEEDGTAVLVIEDNGGGIPSHLLPDKIFEPYVSTKGEKGTGIGLSMSKTIITKRIGGKIVAKNSSGGAQFVITVPLEGR